MVLLAFIGVKNYSVLVRFTATMRVEARGPESGAGLTDYGGTGRECLVVGSRYTVTTIVNIGCF